MKNDNDNTLNQTDYIINGLITSIQLQEEQFIDISTKNESLSTKIKLIENKLKMK